jgi:plastocyanin
VRLRIPTASCLALALLLTTAASPAQPRLGAIRGRVDVQRVVIPAERRPNPADFGTPPPREIPDLRRAVVYLETAPAAALESRELVRARMDQRNETFLPHVLAIDQGTLVDFPNNDSTYHNVFSLSRTRKFDLGRYARGKSKSVRFERAGVVRIFCDIHSHMSAFILVFSHRYFAVTQPDGTFQLPPVPAGTYMLAGWYEGEVRANRQVVVRAGETSVADLPVQ